MNAGRLPVWERLRAADRRRLRVEPPREVSVEELLVHDGDLPELDRATVFDAWPRHDGGVGLRAARIDDVRVTTYAITARRLRIERSDGRLEALLAGSGAVAAEGELERLACACRGVSADAVYRAIGEGWDSAEEVKRATRLAFGPCQGRRCVPWLVDRLELDPSDPLAQVSPRPPLVPVPASVLAVFGRQP
ncbi:MAG: (2Fe-2S)-binding protein [Candidatus Limnocylindria bacterium]